MLLLSFAYHQCTSRSEGACAPLWGLLVLVLIARLLIVAPLHNSESASSPALRRRTRHACTRLCKLLHAGSR